MARNTLTCERNISGETLSAWRDAMLPPAEMERIRIHAASCAACQARLADFDEVARALLRQRELEPAGRILAGVRVRAAQRPRRAWGGLSPRPRVWSGLGALGAVAAVLLLFVYVLGFGPGRPGAPSGGKTPTASQSATATLTPTATPVSTSQLSPVVDVTTAWGSHAATVIVEADDSSHVMNVGGITPDGRYLLGEEFTLAANGSIDYNVPAQAGFMSVATKHFTPIGISDPAGYPPRCCFTDGRFLVAIHDTQPGATCGLCHSEYWAYDLTTGQLYRVARGTDYGLIQRYFLSHGLFIMETGQGIMVANLATRTVAPLAGIPSMGIAVFSWPYVLYFVQENLASTDIRVRNLATGQDIALPQVDALFTATAGGGSFAIAGDTLFVAVVAPSSSGNPSNFTSTLYQIDMVMRNGAQAVPIAIYQGGDQGGDRFDANSRVVVCGSGVWDRAEKRFVTLNGSVLPLAGDYLATYLQGDSPVRAVGPMVTIYNTATLPVKTGG